MWKRILAHGAAALATPGLQPYRLCMRVLVFVAVFVAGCATSPFPEEPARSADRALTLRELRSDSTKGRFLVRTPKFFDPAISAPARRLTVLSTVAGRSERRVGDLPYTR
jgi:starvation-inducible outer membrane lipoprotein